MESKKKIGKILMVLSLLFILFAIVLLIPFKDDTKKEDLKENSTEQIENGIIVNDIKMIKNTDNYNVTISIENKSNKKIDFKKYNVYFLDKNNNLLYTFDGISLGTFNQEKIITSSYNISYDISSLYKIEILEKNRKLDFNEDLQGKLKYLGEVKIIN